MSVYLTLFTLVFVWPCYRLSSSFEVRSRKPQTYSPYVLRRLNLICLLPLLLFRADSLVVFLFSHFMISYLGTSCTRNWPGFLDFIFCYILQEIPLCWTSFLLVLIIIWATWSIKLISGDFRPSSLDGCWSPLIRSPINNRRWEKMTAFCPWRLFCLSRLWP